MSIKPIINEPMRVIALSCESEVLEKNSYDQLHSYQMSRDLSKLDLTDIEDYPTIFTILPLLTEYEYLLSSIRQGNTSLQRELVRLHTIDIEGMEAKFDQIKGRKILSKDTVNLIPLKAIEELAQIIEEGTTRGAETVPFSIMPSIVEEKKQVELKKIFA